MEDQRDELSREELEAFRSLRETPNRSFGNEDRIISALKEHGLIRSSSHRGHRWFVQAAAAAAVLAGTFFVGVQYGRQSRVPINPVVTPAIHEQSEPIRPTIDRDTVEDPSILDEYRDEPDRPGNGKVIVARYPNR
jgi:hypothetical protein